MHRFLAHERSPIHGLWPLNRQPVPLATVLQYHVLSVATGAVFRSSRSHRCFGNNLQLNFLSARLLRRYSPKSKCPNLLISRD